MEFERLCLDTLFLTGDLEPMASRFASGEKDGIKNFCEYIYSLDSDLTALEQPKKKEEIFLF